MPGIPVTLSQMLSTPPGHNQFPGPLDDSAESTEPATPRVNRALAADTDKNRTTVTIQPAKLQAELKDLGTHNEQYPDVQMDQVH